MRFLTTVGIMFYAIVVIFIGLALVIFALNYFPVADFAPLVSYAQNNLNSRIAIGLSGIVIIIISFSFAQFMLGKMQREKTIAFPTQSGIVTIALTAVEDLIKRLIAIFPEIKELRPDVTAKKKGSIEVDVRIVLKAEANIPELTSRLQDMIRTRIQEVLGIEEQILIKIHIAKIVLAEEKESRKKKDSDYQEPNVPFGGYGRV